MKKRNSNNKWFVRVRGSYLPSSWQGWLTYIPYISYLVLAMYAIAQTFGNDEWLLAVVLYVPAAAAAAAVMHWIASNKS